MSIANELFFEQVEAEITAGNPVEILVRGHSMRPLLRSDRDRVVLSSVNTQRLTVGDVVLFRFRGRHILHRIIRIECRATEPGAVSKHTAHTTTTQHFTLSGDGNNGTTEQCTEADMVAVVIAVIRPSGHIVSTQSLRWRIASRTWATLPRPVRGIAWRILQKLGYQ